MNKKIIFIFILTILAFVALWAYSFGPFSGARIIRANPASLKPVPQQMASADKNVAFNIYHNKDLTENFYAIKFPQTWQLQPNNSAGSYRFVFNNGNGSAELQDVADNTTLELFVLSQQEPNFKKSVAGYKHIGYQKLSINNNESYQLIYLSSINGADYETIKTYITGQDHAAVVTLTALQNIFAGDQALFTSILESFQWENK